mgnify:CR=1 FL=1
MMSEERSIMTIRKRHDVFLLSSLNQKGEKMEVIRFPNGKYIDFYKFCKYILGYDKLSEPHKRWCETLERERKKHKRLMFLKPRGTFKSTIYTVSYTLWRIILDKYKYNDIPHRILIASATNELACQFLGEIRQQLMLNEKLKWFGLTITKETQQEIWLKRRTIHKEPTIKAKGALAAITSEHYDLIIVDDLCNNEDRESETIRERKKRWYQDLISILEPDGEVLVVGTRWHFDDLYNFIMETNKKLPDKDKYHIEVEAIVDENGNPRFPEIYSKEDVERLKIEKGLVEFHSQYLNSPLPAETQLFKLERMHFYKEEGELARKLDKTANYGYCDPALGREGDYAVVVVGALLDGILYIRDCWLRNDATPDRVVDVIKELHERYNFVRFGVESNGFQSLFSKFVKEKRVPVVEVKNLRNKRVRIESIEPFVSNGQIRFREDWEKAYPELIDQLIKFPVGKYDDAPDALEGLYRIAMKTNVVRIKGLVRGVMR